MQYVEHTLLTTHTLRSASPGPISGFMLTSHLPLGRLGFDRPGGGHAARRAKLPHTQPHRIYDAKSTGRSKGPQQVPFALALNVRAIRQVDESKRRVDLRDPGQLLAEMQATSWRAVARRYGTSDTTIRRRIRFAGLMTKARCDHSNE